jgi:hypothetical protein
MARMSESNDMIDNLFLNRPLAHSRSEVARKLREERWSVDQVIQVLERSLSVKQTLNFDRAAVALTNPDFQIQGIHENAKVNYSRDGIFDTYMTCLIRLLHTR